MKEAEKKNFTVFDEILLCGRLFKNAAGYESRKEAFPSIEPKLFDPDESVAKGAAIFGWKLNIDAQLQQKVSENTGVTKEKVDLEKFQKLKLKKLLNKLPMIWV